MGKVMLVNVTHVEESRVAIVEDGVLAAYEIETLNRSNIVGNIHNVVVENVLPSIEASFCRLTNTDLKGFLPLDEVNFKLLPARGEGKTRGKIASHLHPGQRLMAQVIREPLGNKPPTVSTYFSLPGRFLVLMPGVDNSGISRKIEDAKQRDRLKKIVSELNPPEGFGVIVRTAGIGQTKTELQRDLRYLLRLWESIQRASSQTPFPGLVYQERDLVIRTIRDYFTPDIDEVWIDSEETYERALAFVRDVMPNRAKTLRIYSGDRPLFNKHNLEEQIESIYRRRVTLPSGGEIVIDGTEALTAIDVNSARSNKKGDVEETATATNLEAAGEIARQLRLRDLGGLIVVDFIDMMVARNKQQVEKAMRDALRQGKARYDVTRISKLGLVEIARQRLKSEKLSVSYATCPSCDGHGLIKNVEAAALAALRKLQTRALRGDAGRIRLGLPTEVAAWMLNHKRRELTEIERRSELDVEVAFEPGLLRHDSTLETFPRETGARPETRPPTAARSVGDRPAPRVAPDASELDEATRKDAPETEPPGETGEAAAPTPARRRRRRGRGSRGGRTAEAAAEATNETPAPAEESAEPPREAGESNQTTAPTEGDNDEAPPKRRRRRRRRRGRAGNGTENAPNDGDEPEPAAAVAAPRDETPPAQVRVDELVPAATGNDPSQKPAARSRRRRPAGGRD